MGDLLLVVMGMAETGRVIAVMCENVSRTTRYKIRSVKALSGSDLDEWRRRVR